MSRRTAAVLTLICSLSSVPARAAQHDGQVPQGPPAASPSIPAPEPAQSVDSASLPIDLTRIKTVLERNPSGTVADAQVRFYLEVVAKQPTFKQFIGSYDLFNGPVKGAPMTHQEFLDLVTPREFNHPGGYNAVSALAKLTDKLRNARNDAEVTAIRAQIERELASLRGGGQ